MLVTFEFIINSYSYSTPDKAGVISARFLQQLEIYSFLKK